MSAHTKDIRIFESEIELLKAIADYFVQIANETVAMMQRFAVVLSGGNSPKKLYALLASDAYKNKVNWNEVDFFFGDERYVPHSDNASNYKMANDVLLHPLNIPSNHIYAVDTSLPPEASALDYAGNINNYFNAKAPQFDLVLLGLGDNAHTASLFPYTPVLNETSATIKPVFIEELQSYRITFTAPLINLASNIAFLVYGTGKETAVKSILQGEKNFALYPAQLIEPTHGQLVWFLDKPAASRLKEGL